jgi:hypothetical protein
MIDVNEFELCSAHLGNGLSVWIKDTDIPIAFINADREVTYRKKDELTPNTIAYIEKLAREDDRTISVTQDQKVFNDRPK